MDRILETRFDYVADAIDTLSPKVFLIIKTYNKGYPLISSMGSGGKIEPSSVKVADISASYNCRLAFSIRKQLNRKNIKKGFKVVFSTEKASKDAVQLVEGEENKKSIVGTISYMPPLFGIYMASEIIKDLLVNK